MGCGSSSLKGEAEAGTGPNNPAPAPLRQVKTDFSQVDYDRDAQKRRMTEYAPNEEVRPKSKASDAAGGTGLSSLPEGVTANGSKSQGVAGGVDGIDPTTTSNSTAPHPITIDEVNKSHPLQFSNSIDDGLHGYGKNSTDVTNSNHQQHQNSNSFSNNNDATRITTGDYNLKTPSAGGGVGQDGVKAERKSSWLGQKYSKYQEAKRGPGVSDEELKKQLGMDRKELEEWSRDRPIGANSIPAHSYAGVGIVGGGLDGGSGGGGGM